MSASVGYEPDHCEEEDNHDGHDGQESCACAAGETQHPFTLDCSAASALATAEGTLISAGCQPTEASCEALSDASGTGSMMMVCQTAFFILQAHHDFCEHDTLSSVQEGLVHDFEDACHSCNISRPFDAAIRNCNIPNCDDPAPAIAAFETLNGTCVAGASCCGSAVTQDAYALIFEYHEICHESDIPQFVEHAIHDFEAACEAYGECNTPMSASVGYEPDHCEEEGEVHDHGTDTSTVGTQSPPPPMRSSVVQLQAALSLAVAIAALSVA